MVDYTQSVRNRWIGDVVTIVLLAASFYLLEGISIYGFGQWLGYVPPWEAKSKFITFAVVLCVSLGGLLGFLSGLLVRSKHYLFAVCPALLVAVAHVVQIPRFYSVLSGRWVEAFGYVLSFGFLYVGIAVGISLTLTVAKRRWDFARARVTTIRIALPLLTLGIGGYLGWGLGRTSVAAPDLIHNARINLSLLHLLENHEEDRLRGLLESTLDNYALAMPVWRKGVLRRHTREQMNDALIRIARYRQEHPKDTNYDVGPEEYEQQWLKAWQEMDRQLEEIYRQALESAPTGTETEPSQTDLPERKKRAGPDGAATGSQPIRSVTNRTSSAPSTRR